MTPSWLFASFFVSTVGLGFFLYGKKQVRMIPLSAGIAMMVYPMFIGSALIMYGLAGAIVGGVWVSGRYGA